MKRISLYIVLGLCSLLTGYNVSAQTSVEAEQMLKKLNEKVLNAKNISIRYNFSFLNEKNKVTRDYDGFYVRKGNMVHLSQMGTEVIQNGKLRVIIDSSSSTIITSQPDEKISMQNIDFAASLKSCKKTEIRDSNGYKVLEMTFDPKRYPLRSLIIVTRNGMPHEVIMKHSRVSDDQGEFIHSSIIRYEKIRTNKAISNSEFNTGKVVVSRNGNYQTTSAYKKYKLYNLQ